MDSLSNIFKDYEIAEKQLSAYEWQNRASQIVDKLCVPKNLRSQIYKWVKNDRTKVESALEYVTDNANVKSPLGYFIWLMTYKMTTKRTEN